MDNVANDDAVGEITQLFHLAGRNRWIVNIRFTPTDRTAWERVASIETKNGTFQVIERGFRACRTLSRDGWPDFVFAFHDGDKIGPRMLARVAKRTGLTPDDL